ncbi:DNA-binding transcriptional regulator, MarR family [Paenibacillus sp. UNCCL117]|uniref:MarR family winged helix-turn-helix transcriptional regulator n=1 Tax=unclassified Paenibacillus TaxID=185978 RepID=UPI00088A1FAE|nr:MULTISPECIES: MarR family transcriptional regulator [unclassified Paenibacillus]SDD17564.1 DNA-binding transcriptional regulator, MarR family [Paenibacillus sp. cl123]SFW35003.1 DNA-binding transcriptional regulator, MarR family [Paenibacillus sp. UNCCL117]
MNDLVQLIKEINQVDYNINVMLRCEFDQLIEENLTDKQVIVLNLIRDNDSIHAGEIAQRLGITPSAVSQVLSTLEKKSMITRSMNKQNRREVHLKLTHEAEQYFSKVEAVEMAIIEKYYSKLSIKELNQLKAILEKFEGIIAASAVQAGSGGDI